MNNDESGFLARWSRRKAQVRAGHVPAAPAAPAPVNVPPEPTAVDPAPPVAAVPEAAVPALPVAAEAVAAPPQPEPPPTLADVAQLTRESDYTRFVAPGVNSDVKNAALKTLFGDPHFNVMDGLDTYIDDYNKPDPLPAGVALQMMQSKFLGRLQPDPVPDPAPGAAPDALAAASADTPISKPGPDSEPPSLASNEDADLRLQPHDAAGRRGAEPGAGADPIGSG
jgi:Protein of unknown function (DUF3306)